MGGAQACWQSCDDAAAERQRLYMRRLKDKAAAMASSQGHGKSSLTKHTG
jgi:hypothetical protein